MEFALCEVTMFYYSNMEIYVCKQPPELSRVENKPSDIGKCLVMPTIGSKVIRALDIILAIFLRFKYQFLSSHAFYEQNNA